MSPMCSVASWWYVSIISCILQLVSCGRFTANLTLYTHPLSWNQARRVCEENGGTLLETQYGHLYDFVQEFKASDPWKNYRNITEFWIGVYSDTNVYDKSGMFWRWSSNCELVPEDNPLPSQTEHFKCIAEDMTSPGWWMAALCGVAKPFVCSKETTPDCDTEIHPESTLKEILLTTGQVTKLGYVGSVYDACAEVCLAEPTCWAFVHNDNFDCFRYSTTNMSALLDPANYDHTTTSRLTLIKCHHAFVNTTVLGDFNYWYYMEPEVPCAPHHISNQTTTAEAKTTVTLETTAKEATVISETSSAATESTPLEEKRTTEMSSTLETTTGEGDKMRTTVRTRIASTATTPESISTIGTEGLTLQLGTEKTTASSIRHAQTTFPSTSELTSPSNVASDLTTPAQQTATGTPLFTSTSSDSWVETSVHPTNASSNFSDEFCACGCSSEGMTENEKAEFIGKILKELTKDKANFSLSRRRYISVMDERPSAQNVGVAGVILLTVAFGGIILLDLSTLGRDLSNLKKNIQSLLSRRSSEGM